MPSIISLKRSPRTDGSRLGTGSSERFWALDPEKVADAVWRQKQTTSLKRSVGASDERSTCQDSAAHRRMAAARCSKSPVRCYSQVPLADLSPLRFRCL